MCKGYILLIPLTIAVVILTELDFCSVTSPFDNLLNRLVEVIPSNGVKSPNLLSWESKGTPQEIAGLIKGLLIKGS